MESSSTREKTSVPIDGAIHMHIETKQIVAIVFFLLLSGSTCARSAIHEPRRACRSMTAIMMMAEPSLSTTHY